jgi:hypothetical protein
LLLRPIWVEDWQRRAGQASGTNGVVRNLASAPWPYGEENARAFVAADAVEPLFPRSLITRAADAAVRYSAASGSIRWMMANQLQSELGYWIAQQPLGPQGYATEAGSCDDRQLPGMLGHPNGCTAAHFSRQSGFGAESLRKLGICTDGPGR